MCDSHKLKSQQVATDSRLSPARSPLGQVPYEFVDISEYTCFDKC